MKHWILSLVLILATATARAQYVLESVSNTASTGDMINVPTNAPWGFTDNSRQARLGLTNSGYLKVSGFATINGTLPVSLTAEALLALTQTAANTLSISNTVAAHYAWVTTTAGGTAARGGTATAFSLTGTAMWNITSAAGADVPCEVCIYTGNGPNAAFYYLFNNVGTTWIPPFNQLAAVSSTVLCKTMGRGTSLELSATASAVTVTVGMSISPIQ